MWKKLRQENCDRMRLIKGKKWLYAKILNNKLYIYIEVSILKIQYVNWI